MERELRRLRNAAAALEADLRRNVSNEWTCRVGDDYALLVSEGARTATLLIPVDVDEEAFQEEAFAAPYRDASLDDDATEAVFDAVVHTMRTWGLTPPQCQVHGLALDPIGGVWFCPSKPPHDVALLGSLGVE